MWRCPSREPNAGCIALLHNHPLPAADHHSAWLTGDVAQAKHYGFVPGDDMDDVIAGYRRPTRKAEIMPK